MEEKDRDRFHYEFRSLVSLPITIEVPLTRLSACGCAIVRSTKLGSLSHHKDITWNTTALLLWAGAEANVITICASVPAIVPLFQQKVRSRGSSAGDSARYLKGRTDTLTAPSFNDRSISYQRSSFIVGTETGELNDKVPAGQITATTVVSVEHDQP